MSQPEQNQEKATVLEHVAKASFPAVHLSPWMSQLSKKEAFVIALSRTIADGAEELDRRAWLDKVAAGEEVPPDSEEEAEIDGTTRISAEERREALRRLGLDEKTVGEVEGLFPAVEDVVNGEDEEEEPIFRTDRVRGASGMVGFVLRSFADNIHDIAPSVNGLARRQAMSLGMAHGEAGVAVLPKGGRSIWQRITLRGRDKDQVSGGI